MEVSPRASSFVIVREMPCQFVPVCAQIRDLVSSVILAMSDAVKLTTALSRSHYLFTWILRKALKSVKVNLQVSCSRFSIAPLVSCTDMGST